MKVENVAAFLNVMDDARAAALKRTIDRDRTAKAEKAAKADRARHSAPAGGKNGGKGNSTSGRDARNQDRGQGRQPHVQNRGRPDSRDNRDNRDKRPRAQQDVKVEDKASAGGGRPYKKR